MEVSRIIRDERCPLKRDHIAVCNREMVVEAVMIKNSELQSLVRLPLQNQLHSQLKDLKPKRSLITVSLSSHSLQRLDIVQRTQTKSTKTLTLFSHTLVSIGEPTSSRSLMVTVSLEKKYLISSRRSSVTTLSKVLKTLLTRLKLPKESSIRLK